MDELLVRLDRLRSLLKDEDFLLGRGLSNDVNTRIFCYEAKDEMIVRRFVRRLLDDKTLPCHLIEKNLYRIFLEICEEKKILSRMEDIEGKKGKEYLLQQIYKAVPCQAYVKKICEEPFESRDVLLLTGVGDVHPFLRVPPLLEALQSKMEDTSLLVMEPGKFDGRQEELFGRLQPVSYYRAFNIV